MKQVLVTNMRKLAMMMLVAAMAFTFVACSSDEQVTEATEEATTEETTEAIEETTEATEETETTEATETTEVTEETTESEEMDEVESESEDDVAVYPDEDMTVLGEGEISFVFTVTFEDATMNLYEINTDAATVGEALVAVDLIAGEDSEYGMYVTTVADVTLDWDTDAAYWGFYKDGEMLMTGVDSTEIEEGATYTLAYTK